MMTQPAIQEQEINLQQFLHVLRRRYPYLAAIFLLMMLFAGVHSSRQTPLYQGSALLIFDHDKQSPVDFANMDLGKKADEFLETQKRIITSRKVIGRVLDALDLQGSDFVNKVSVQLLRGTNLMQLRVTDPNPDKAALYTNTLARIYIEYAFEDLRASSTDSFIWLSDQVTFLKDKVKESEMALLKYKQEEELTSIDKKQSTLDDKISELNDNLSKLAMQRVEKESILEEIRGLTDKPQEKKIPEVLENEQLKLLKGERNKIEIDLARISTKFKQNHPERIRLSTQLSFLKKKISAETIKIIKDLEIEYRILLTKENAVKNSLQSLKIQARNIAEQAIEYGVLKREAESNNQMYNVLLERLKETDIGSSIVANNIRIVDKAEIPEYPFSPNIRRNLLLAGVLGLFLGTGACFLLEYFDNTIKSEDELGLLTGLDLIGAIPERKDAISSGGKMDKLVANKYQESKTMLDFYRKEHRFKTLMVTSALPNEGKTCTVVGLGMSYARTGKKVLMIDGDFFKPYLNKILDLPAKSGLFDCFDKEVIPSELAMRTSQENLFLLSSGLIPRNPAELISSKKMEHLLELLAGEFDLVLIDAPPVGASNGISILASYCDGVAFIVRAHSTNYHTANSALRSLEKVRTNWIGAILTRTSKKSGYGYGYGYGDINAEDSLQQPVTQEKIS